MTLNLLRIQFLFQIILIITKKKLSLTATLNIHSERAFYFKSKGQNFKFKSSLVGNNIHRSIGALYSIATLELL